MAQGRTNIKVISKQTASTSKPSPAPTQSSSGRAPSVAPRVPSPKPSSTPVPTPVSSTSGRAPSVVARTPTPSTPVRVSAQPARASSIPTPSRAISPEIQKYLAPPPKTSSIPAPTRKAPTIVTREQDLVAQQMIQQQTQQKQQQVQQQGLSGGFKTIEDQLKALANIGKPQQAYAETAKPFVGPQKPVAGQGITTTYGGFESKEAQAQALKERVQLAKQLPFGGFGSEFAQQEALAKGKKQAQEKYPDIISRVTSVEGLVSSPPSQRQKVTETVEIGGPSFIGGITTDEPRQALTPMPLPLKGILPEPTKESRKEQLLEQRGGAPKQVTVGSIAIDRLASGQILGRGEQIGMTEEMFDPITGKITTRKVSPSQGLEQQVNLAQRKEQDVFRAINVVQADIVRPLSERPEGGRGSMEQAIKFLEGKSTGKIKSPTVITRFGEGVGVMGFDYKDEVGSVYGTVGPTGTAGFDDFGLYRPSTRGALKTEEGRAEISKRLAEPDFSIYESLGYQAPSRPTGELIVTTDRPLGDTSIPVSKKEKQAMKAPQEIGGFKFLTPASLITDVKQPPPTKIKEKEKIGFGGQTLSLGSLIPSFPSAFAEEQPTKQIAKDTRRTYEPEPAPLPKSSKGQKYNPFSPDPNARDTSKVGSIFETIGKQSGVSGAVEQVREYGTGFGESLQNELINIQNFGSFVSQGEIPERPTFQTPSEQVFAGVIGGAVKQATGQGSFVESASKGFEGAGKTIQERPAYSAGDITAQGLLFIPAGIYKAGSFGVKAISGFGKALTGVKTAVKAVPKTVAGKVGSIQTRAVQAEIKLGRALQEDINPASFYTAKTTAVPKVTRKIYPAKPTEQDYSQAFARERAFTTEEGSVTSKLRGKIKPAKPTEQDYSQAFAGERAFAEEIPRGTKAPSRVKSPTGRVDPLERVQQTTSSENLRAFRESEKIGSVFGKSPMRDLPIGQADIGFPFAGLGRSSVEDIIARGGRASTTPLGIGTGRMIKGGTKYKQFGKTAPPADDFTRISNTAFGAGDLGKAGKVAKGASEADDISRFTKAERGAGEGGEFFSGGRGLKLIEPAKAKAPKASSKGRNAIDDAMPDELKSIGKSEIPKGKAPRKLKGGLLPIAGFGTTAGLSAGLIQDVSADTGLESGLGTQQDLFFREATIQTQSPFQGQRAGERQKPSVKERAIQKAQAKEDYQYANIFATPTRTRQPQVQRERLREEFVFGSPEGTPRGRGGAGLFGFGGGSDSGGGMSQSSRKFYRVFDVAKTPFGRVQRGLGVQVQSDAPIYEISDVAGKSPMFNITEQYFAGDQIGQTRKKLKAGKNPLLDENFFG